MSNSRPREPSAEDIIAAFKWQSDTFDINTDKISSFYFPDDAKHTFHIGLVGEEGAGKLSLGRRFVSDLPPVERTNTTFFGGMQKADPIDKLPPGKVTVYGEVIDLQLQSWDLKSNNKPPEACLFVFDITNRKSFRKIKEMLRAIENNPLYANVVKLLVGTHVDLDKDVAKSLSNITQRDLDLKSRQISPTDKLSKTDYPVELNFANKRQIITAEAEEFARAKRIGYIETSSVANINIEELFTTAGRLLLHKNEPELIKKLTDKFDFDNFYQKYNSQYEKDVSSASLLDKRKVMSDELKRSLDTHQIVSWDQVQQHVSSHPGSRADIVYKKMMAEIKAQQFDVAKSPFTGFEQPKRPKM